MKLNKCRVYVTWAFMLAGAWSAHSACSQEGSNADASQGLSGLLGQFSPGQYLASQIKQRSALGNIVLNLAPYVTGLQEKSSALGIVGGAFGVASLFSGSPLTRLLISGVQYGLPVGFLYLLMQKWDDKKIIWEQAKQLADERASVRYHSRKVVEKHAESSEWKGKAEKRAELMTILTSPKSQENWLKEKVKKLHELYQMLTPESQFVLMHLVNTSLFGKDDAIRQNATLFCDVLALLVSDNDGFMVAQKLMSALRAAESQGTTVYFGDLERPLEMPLHVPMASRIEAEAPIAVESPIKILALDTFLAVPQERENAWWSLLERMDLTLSENALGQHTEKLVAQFKHKILEIMRKFSSFEPSSSVGRISDTKLVIDRIIFGIYKAIFLEDKVQLIDDVKGRQRAMDAIFQKVDLSINEQIQRLTQLKAAREQAKQEREQIKSQHKEESQGLLQQGASALSNWWYGK